MNDLEIERKKLLGSFLLFTRTFYKLRTGREFNISHPSGRESHHITISRALTDVFYLRSKNLNINVPPGHGKSTFLVHFTAWAFAHYADCQFLYISYSSELATEHTYTVKQIMQMPHYRELFGVEIKTDSSAKDNFKTTQGGAVKAFGSAGSITGQDAGLPHLERFSGAVIMDDMHKPDEVHSETKRENVKKNYKQTIFERPRGMNVPMIFIGQRLHQDDLPANLIGGMDGLQWDSVILKGLDEKDNALYPEYRSRERLITMREKMPIEFAAQQQQSPLPAGGGIFKRDWFVLLDKEPEIVATFITIDAAETDKTYNDATALSLFGLYKIHQQFRDTGEWGLHWIDCQEIRVNPDQLEESCLQFIYDACRHPIPPKIIAIEKKSLGTYLLAKFRALRGLKVMDIDRNRNSGNKTKRFIDCQLYVSSGLISLPKYGRHTKMCLDHMEDITANDSHLHDDIADTCADGIKLGLADKIIINTLADSSRDAAIAQNIMGNFHQLQRAKGDFYASR